MIGLVILEAIIIGAMLIFFGDIYYRVKHPEFIFEIDDSDPDDVKFTMSSSKAPEDLRPGRVYVIKTVRKN